MKLASARGAAAQGSSKAILALFFSALSGAAAQGSSKAFPPGWNKEAQTPPLGWRSWNAFHAAIDNSTFVAAIDILTAKEWTVGGSLVSLADVGYSRVGIDEGWENCSGPDPNHGLRQHDEQGYPLVDTAKFPDLKWLVDYGHARSISMGWYLNGCACGERVERDLNYKGDVARLAEYGFDAVKLDGCGAATNMTRYAELMAATGKSYAVENCHWGHCGADSWYHNPDGSSCPTQQWCPFNWFRTSGDINSGEQSWFGNLQTATKFLDWAKPLSVPTCWAYPDMLEVGLIAEPLNASSTAGAWNRAHFGAWCVISAPLVLGLDLTKREVLQSIVPIVTNKDAIAVNQQWAGHPGGLVHEWPPPPPPSPPPPAEGAADGDERTNATVPSVTQLWAKPQPGGKVAALVINNSPHFAAVQVHLAYLNITAPTAKVRDIWAQADLPDPAVGMWQANVPAYDSAFVLFTPSPAAVGSARSRA